MNSSTTPAALRRRRLTKRTAALTVALLGGASLSVALAGSASADPYGQLVAVGSDTTQYVMNGLAAAAGSNLLASYDAVDPANSTTYATNSNELIKPKPLVKAFDRPNGSKDGVRALKASSGGTEAAPWNAITAGSIDIARSSAGPAEPGGSPGGGTLVSNGTLTFIPFGVDAVSIVTGPATATPDSGVTGGTDLATNLPTVGSFTKQNLIDLYWFGVNTIAGGVEYHPVGTNVTAGAAAGHGAGNVLAGSDTQSGAPTDPANNDPIVNVHLYVPQSGSGTRNFFIGVVSANADTGGALPANGAVYDHYSLGTGAPIEEHNGAIVATDANGIAPFSAAQWVAESKAGTIDTVDNRHGSQLISLGGVSPLKTLGALKFANPAFSIIRDVYNVVPSYKLPASDYSGDAAGTTGAPDAKLDKLLVGASSTVCSNSSVIRNYGFDVLSDGDANGYTCGQDTVRSYTTFNGDT